MQRIKWELEYLSAPGVIRHCSKCGEKTQYESSGLFRINAQKKSLDIWMVYRCGQCDNTWNAQIYTRISPGRLNPEILEQFHQNKPELAENYAMNTEWLKKLQAEYVLPEYTVTGCLPKDLNEVEIQILNQYAIPYKVSAVLRKKLGLSHKALQTLIDEGQIRLAGGTDLKNLKMPKELTITFKLLSSIN